MEFQESEVVCLVLALVFAVALVVLRRAERLPDLPLLYGAAGFMIAATIFTVLEGALWYSVFNILEHVCYALAGVFLALGCWQLIGREPPAGKGGR